MTVLCSFHFSFVLILHLSHFSLCCVDPENYTGFEETSVPNRIIKLNINLPMDKGDKMDITFSEAESSISQGESFEMEMLFPVDGPQNLTGNKPEERTEESDENQEKYSETSCPTEQASLKAHSSLEGNKPVDILQESDVSEEFSEASSSNKEPLHVVEYIKGFHFVVFSKEKPGELELVSAENLPSHHKDSLPKSQKQMPNDYLEFTFYQLAAELKDLELPSPDWKIMITLKGRKIMEIKFTDSSDSVGRSVSFSHNSDSYEIIVDGRPAELMSSHTKLQDKAELEGLLEIVESI